jgi:hypothetical protein
MAKYRVSTHQKENNRVDFYIVDAVGSNDAERKVRTKRCLENSPDARILNVEPWPIERFEEMRDPFSKIPYKFI